LLQVNQDDKFDELGLYEPLIYGAKLELYSISQTIWS